VENGRIGQLGAPAKSVVPKYLVFVANAIIAMSDH
jgi:hypothetical protein